MEASYGLLNEVRKPSAAAFWAQVSRRRKKATKISPGWQEQEYRAVKRVEMGGDGKWGVEVKVVWQSRSMRSSTVQSSSTHRTETTRTTIAKWYSLMIFRLATILFSDGNPGPN